MAVLLINRSRQTLWLASTSVALNLLGAALAAPLVGPVREAISPPGAY
jgi:hypothetical protein